MSQSRKRIIQLLGWTCLAAVIAIIASLMLGRMRDSATRGATHSTQVPESPSAGPAPGTVSVQSSGDTFVEAPGVDLVRAHCTACHASDLVTQNRATREGWEAIFRWMQKTQKLWPLGDAEPEILDYLARHYGPAKVGRRRPLEDIEWYDLPATSEENAD